MASRQTDRQPLRICAGLLRVEPMPWTLLRRSTVAIAASPAPAPQPPSPPGWPSPPPDPASAALASSSFTVAAAEKALRKNDRMLLVECAHRKASEVRVLRTCSRDVAVVSNWSCRLLIE
eukprot:4593802-Prymnesium_polylepis.1